MKHNIEIHVQGVRDRQPLFTRNLGIGLNSAPRGFRQKFFWDDDNLGCVQNFLKNVSDTDQTTTAILSFQEDTLLTRNFWSAFTEILDKWNGQSIVSFYTPGWKAVELAAAENLRLIRSPIFALWNQAILLPASIARSLSQFAKEKTTIFETDAAWDDFLLKLYSAEYEIPAFYVVPSLVQHIGVDTSSVGNSKRILLNRYRTAPSFLTEYTPLSINWNFERYYERSLSLSAADRAYLK